MMQTPKYEFIRKPKRQGSRDKLLAVGIRQKSRESEDRRSQEPNSSKPHQLISSLRSQLTNLRQEVAKLSRKDMRKPQQTDPEHRSPRDRKPVASYYFQEVQSTMLEEENTISKGRSADPTSHRPSTKEQSAETEMKERIKELQQDNEELAKRNELIHRAKETSEAAKREYEMKIYQVEVQRQRSARQKDTQQIDRTITFQKQLVENKQQIEQLKQTLHKLTTENQQLKNKLDQAKLETEKTLIQAQQKELLLQDKEHQITQMNLLIKDAERQQQAKDLQHRLQMDTLNQQLSNLKRQMTSISTIAQLATTKYESSEKKSIDLQRKLQQLLEKQSKQTHSQPDKRKSRSTELRELNDIIALQQKSLLNQQSDINYLENEVRRLAHYKHTSRCQERLLQELNAELLKVHLSRLNDKYSAQ